MDNALTVIIIIILTVILIVLAIPFWLAKTLNDMTEDDEPELVLHHGEQYRLRTNLASFDGLNHEVFRYNEDTDRFENNACSVKAELVRVNLILAEKL